MHLCLDIDDTITYAPEFFRLLSELVQSVPNSSITIITFRNDREQAIVTLDEHGIVYNQLIVSSDSSFPRVEGETLAQWKARVVNDLAPDWFFEDMPEVVVLVGEHVKVFMPCDETIRGWLSSAIGASSS